MRSRLLAVVLAFCLLPLCLCAEERGQGRQEAGVAHAEADSIGLSREASREDFITASLLVVDPGEAIYTSFGHAALRMQCPSKGLDFCFTFEMDLDAGSLLQFLRHRAKAGFAAAPTELFLQQYRAAQRGVKAYELCLTPSEEQELWRNLDREVAAGATWDYDYPAVNCVSMCVYVVEKSLHTRQLDYGLRPPLSQGSYSALVAGILPDNTWQQLFWRAVVGLSGKDSAVFTDKLSPAMLADVWQHAIATDSLHHAKQLLWHRAVVLVPPGPPIRTGWFTPRVFAAILLLGILAGVAFWVHRRFGQYRKQ